MVVIPIKSTCAVHGERVCECAETNQTEADKEKDFELTYFDNIDNIVVDGLDQNQKFFTFLLKNKEFKKEILGTFAEEIYKALRKGIKSEE